MASVWIRSGLIAWIKGAPERRRADTPLRGTPEDDDEPLYDQSALDSAVAKEREDCARICDEAKAKSRNALVRSAFTIAAGEIRSRT